MSGPRINDRNIETAVSILLRIGVSLAGIVVFCGGVFYLLGNGHQIADYSKFTGTYLFDRSIPAITSGAIHLHARSIIQFGILLLIATPIARVVLALVAFGLEGDRTYVVITSIVLAVLLYSVISGILQV